MLLVSVKKQKKQSLVWFNLIGQIRYMKNHSKSNKATMQANISHNLNTPERHAPYTAS